MRYEPTFKQNLDQFPSLKELA